MDEALPRRRNRKQGVALRRRLGHAAANEQNDIGALDARPQLRIGRETDFAGVSRALAVEDARAPKRAGHGQVEPFGEAGEGLARPLRPAATAEDGDRPLGAPEHLLQFRHLRLAGPDRHGGGARRVGRLGRLGQHVLGQRDHHRSRPALHGDMKRPLNDLRDLRRVVDLGRPFGDRAEKSPVVHLLKGPPTEHRPLDLADEQDHRRGIMLGDMDAMRGVGCARAAGDEADSRPAGQPAFGQRHHRRPGFLAADRHLDRRIVERVERREIGLAGDAIDALDALNDKLIDENPPAGAGA